MDDQDVVGGDYVASEDVEDPVVVVGATGGLVVVDHIKLNVESVVEEGPDDELAAYGVSAGAGVAVVLDARSRPGNRSALVSVGCFEALQEVLNVFSGFKEVEDCSRDIEDRGCRETAEKGRRVARAPEDREVARVQERD